MGNPMGRPDDVTYPTGLATNSHFRPWSHQLQKCRLDNSTLACILYSRMGWIAPGRTNRRHDDSAAPMRDGRHAPRIVGRIASRTVGGIKGTAASGQLRTHMVRSGSLLAAGLFLPCFQLITAITVELLETIPIQDADAFGIYEPTLSDAQIVGFGGDPIDAGCPSAGKCVGLLTRDGSLDLDSRYGCTQPPMEDAGDDDSFFPPRNACNVQYTLSRSDQPVKISAVRIALHPDSVTEFNIYVDGDFPFAQWQATPGTTEMQEISVLKGQEVFEFWVAGVMEEGDYLGIIETEIYVEVDEVDTTGTPASSRVSVSATATTDAESAMNTLDGDVTEASSWTCSSGEVCEITYDLQATESVGQLRIGISDSTNTGGTLNFMAAGESGEFFTVRTGIEAGGRPVGSDGLQTFGGVRALARYVKIVAIPASGGIIVINEVEIRVGEDAPQRPVTEKTWLKPTGPLPFAANPPSDDDPNYDLRTANDGGCDPPTHFEGCHVYYIKDGDIDSTYVCGPLAAGSRLAGYEDCEVDFNLNFFRYVRQIQFAFDKGDEEHHQFTIEAYTVLGWVTVVPSAITSGLTTGYQTFDVAVHANIIRIRPTFQTYNQWIRIKEMIILERRKNDFVAGTVPVFGFRDNFSTDDDDGSVEIEPPTRFKFDIPAESDNIRFIVSESTITAVRMKFPANREFVFNIEYDGEDDDISEEFTSAGGERMWETFTLSIPATDVDDLTIVAVSGPSFVNVPTYPTLRVVDFQIVGEPLARAPGRFEVNIKRGNYFVDGPIFVKSGVTLSGETNLENPTFTFFFLYDGTNNGNTAEDGMIVIDGATDAEVREISLSWKTDPTGDIVPGTIGNLAIDVRNSQDLRFEDMDMDDTRTGAARFVDSSNISAVLLESGTYETGNYMDLIRIDDFYFNIIPAVRGLLIEDSHNVHFDGLDERGLPDPELHPSSSGDQAASVVITGDSSGIVFQDLEISVGAAPRILMESTEPLTLDNIVDYVDAVSGDCIVQVPEGTTDDLIVQVNADQTLSKSGNCWVLD